MNILYKCLTPACLLASLPACLPPVRSPDRPPHPPPPARLPACLTVRFTLHKLVNMRRTGVRKPRPLLDQEKLDLFRGHDSITVAKKFDRLMADVER
ncbi:hypothetical protein DPMN_184914 [Dreissena polymorpha]|uniref:Uncharacterized protein n=1 Tax=Dreissena polymorpha TaxID=45954 RepID=A0A9D4DK44_DREPO|nr:hypothetical protein DPMN_184914 [Dreissena polymorpha]